MVSNLRAPMLEMNGKEKEIGQSGNSELALIVWQF